jgi:hypothetical protein
MKIDIYTSPNLFVEHSKEIEVVLRRAVRSALIKHKQAGNPIAVWRNGRVELISPEEIIIEPLADDQT